MLSPDDKPPKDPAVSVLPLGKLRRCSGIVPGSELLGQGGLTELPGAKIEGPRGKRIKLALRKRSILDAVLWTDQGNLMLCDIRAVQQFAFRVGKPHTKTEIGVSVA